MIAAWCALVLPSLYVADKYLGWRGAVAYAVAAACVVALEPRLRGPRSERAVVWCAVATMVAVVAAFALIYPRVNIHAPGLGSDDDDAYNVGALALIAGRSPYDYRTYLGNVLHQLPGAFILAMPFVLAGTSALQNLFWLPLFFVAVSVETGSRGFALRFALLVLLLSPTVMHQVVTGTGHAANTVYVLLGLWWLLRTKHLKSASVAWGVALASRANFLFLLPFAFGWLRRHRGTKDAWQAVALCSATAVSLTLPFYVHDPVNFGPLEAANRVLRFDATLPLAGEIVIATMGAIAVGLAVRGAGNEAALFRDCAVVQAFPVVAGVLLGALRGGRFDLSYLAYGTFASWFAMMSIAVRRTHLRRILADS